MIPAQGGFPAAQTDLADLVLMSQGQDLFRRLVGGQEASFFPPFKKGATGHPAEFTGQTAPGAISRDDPPIPTVVAKAIIFPTVSPNFLLDDPFLDLTVSLNGIVAQGLTALTHFVGKFIDIRVLTRKKNLELFPHPSDT